MNITVKNRSNQDLGHLGSYLESFLPFAQKRLQFNAAPAIYFDSDEENASRVLGKTAHYNPESMEVVVYVDGRHPKDVIRSLSHELVHHAQNCRGDLNADIAGGTELGYAQNNHHMRNMESEAYEKGNLCMRDWEDSVKVHLQETNYYQTRGDGNQMDKYNKLKEDITRKVVARLMEEQAARVTEENSKEELSDGQAEQAKEMLQQGLISKQEYEEMVNPSLKSDREKAERNALGYDLQEDSGYDEKEHDEHNAWNDEDHIEAIEKHLDALKHDRDYEEDHEALEEVDKNTGMEGDDGDDEDDTYMGHIKEEVGDIVFDDGVVKVVKESFDDSEGFGVKVFVREELVAEGDKDHLAQTYFLKVGDESVQFESVEEIAEHFGASVQEEAVTEVEENSDINVGGDINESNDNWYQRNLFENLMKKWVK